MSDDNVIEEEFSPGRYRKKPVVISAVRLTYEDWCEVVAWVGMFTGYDASYDDEGNAIAIIIPTLEGDMRADMGDWIIRGVKGELYPCKPDIFDATYELAPRSTTPEEPDDGAE